MDDCVELARTVRRGVAARYDLPVFLYANAAAPAERVQPGRRSTRRQYEGLRDEIGLQRPRARLRPGADAPAFGAVAVSARPFLIAYNINLDSDDVELAKRIARRVRESGGGLPKVQATGFWIGSSGAAQVSMNLLDFAVTPMWLVWDTVRELAAEDGVELASPSSSVWPLWPPSLAWPIVPCVPADPVEARLAAAAGYLRLRDFSPLQALELRLEAARTAAAMSGWPVPRHRGRSRRRAVPRAPHPRCGRDRHDGRRVRAGPSPGRRRAGSSRRESADPGRRRAPVVAVWEGRIAAVGPAGSGRDGARGRGTDPLGRGSPGSMRPAGRSRRGSSTRTRTCCSAARARTSSPPPAGRGLPRDPRGRRRDPRRPSPRRGRRATRSSRPTAGAGSTRCSATA